MLLERCVLLAILQQSSPLAASHPRSARWSLAFVGTDVATAADRLLDLTHLMPWAYQMTQMQHLIAEVLLLALLLVSSH